MWDFLFFLGFFSVASWGDFAVVSLRWRLDAWDFAVRAGLGLGFVSLGLFSDFVGSVCCCVILCVMLRLFAFWFNFTV